VVVLDLCALVSSSTTFGLLLFFFLNRGPSSSYSTSPPLPEFTEGGSVKSPESTPRTVGGIFLGCLELARSFECGAEITSFGSLFCWPFLEDLMPMKELKWIPAGGMD
jgi:hypothetical protein